MLKTKLASAKQFVKDHKLPIAAGAGVAVGASATYFYYDKMKTLLNVPDDLHTRLTENSTVGLYDTPVGLFALVALPNDALNKILD